MTTKADLVSTIKQLENYAIVGETRTYAGATSDAVYQSTSFTFFRKTQAGWTESKNTRIGIFADALGPILPHIEKKTLPGKGAVDLGPKRPCVKLMIPEADPQFEFISLIEKYIKAAAVCTQIKIKQKFPEILTFVPGAKKSFTLRGQPGEEHELLVLFKDKEPVSLYTFLTEKKADGSPFFKAIEEIKYIKERESSWFGISASSSGNFHAKSKRYYATTDLVHNSFPDPSSRKYRKTDEEIKGNNTIEGWGIRIQKLVEVPPTETQESATASGMKRYYEVPGKNWALQMPVITQPGLSHGFKCRAYVEPSACTAGAGNISFKGIVWLMDGQVSLGNNLDYGDLEMPDGMQEVFLSLPNSASAATASPASQSAPAQQSTSQTASVPQSKAKTANSSGTTANVVKLDPNEM